MMQALARSVRTTSTAAYSIVWRALLLAAVAVTLFWRTAAPSVLSGDQAEHQFSAVVLGVPHATGYPLFTMLNALAVRLIPVGDEARRVTLAVGIYSALAVALAFVLVFWMTRSSLSALLAAASLAFSPEFWSLATTAEVYTLQLLLLLGLLAALLRWWTLEREDPALGEQRRGLRHPLALAALLAGLGATHHGSFTPIVAPALLVTVAAPLLGRLRSPAQRPVAARLIGRALLWALLGFAPWLYLAAQFALFHPFDFYRGQGLPYHYYWGNPQSWADVLNLALGGGFRLKVFTHGWERLPALLPGYLWALQHQFWWSGLALGLLGAVALWRRQRRLALWTLLVWLSASLFGLNVASDVPKAHVYFLPAYAVWSLWIGLGALPLARGLARVLILGPLPVRLSRRGVRPQLLLRRLVLLGLLALPLTIAAYRFPHYDRSADWHYRRSAETMLAAVEPNAVILCRWEDCMTLRYLQLVERRALGVQLDQTEPEGGINWAARVPIYAPAHPVYAVSYNADLAERYHLLPVEVAPNLWRVYQ